jgi:hypothetical protein
MAGPLDELVGGLDPVDVATLFGRFKSAVPLGMAAFSRGLNQGEDEALLKKYGTRPLPPMVEPSAQEMQRRAIEEFELRYPTPELRAAILEQMRANRRGEGYDPSTATRRIDFAPQNQPDYKGPVVTPSTGKRRFQAGGGVKKTVQQMKDELMLGGKGKPVKETVDLSRRSFFRLPEAKSFPLAKVDDTALDKLEQKYAKQGQAPTITEKKIEVSPDAGKTKSTLQSLTETPVSRRMMLKSAGAQSLQGILPAGEIAKELGVPTLAQTAQTVAGPVVSAVSADMMPGLVMSAINRGMSKKEAIEFVESQLGGVKPTKAFDPAREQFQIERLYDNLMDPGYAPNEWEFFGPMRPSGALNNMLGTPGADVPPMQLREALRQIKEADSERYRQMINAAKDFSMGSYETTLRNEMMTPENLKKYIRGEHAEPRYQPEHLWNQD